MITIFVGEQRGGRIKLTIDKDCLSPDIIRYDERVFPTMPDVMTAAKMLEARGYTVCVDTMDGCYETGEES